jgi:3-oxoacyl-[acyl-carrier-protein] synthase-3
MHDRPSVRATITGSGIGIPKNVVKNEVLSRIMETTDEWIRTRSGIEQRYYVDPGQGSSDLGMMAAENALAAAGRSKDELDAVIFATMTPDHFFPGNGPVLQAKMGLPENIPTFDIRQQCSGFLYGLELADTLIQSRKYKRVLLIGADVHTPFMPWQNGWDITIGREDREVTPEEYAANTAVRDRTVLFGDGAGAVVFEAGEDGRGVLASKLYTNGTNIEALYVPGVGFRHRPYVSHAQIDASEFIPAMEGREVFKQAVSRMPEAVRAVCAEAGVQVPDIDVLIIHQANLRIVEAVAKQLGLPAEKVPHNIERYGNTTAGTLPILYHECVESGRIQPGMLVCFTALGAGLHWGAALYRA